MTTAGSSAQLARNSRKSVIFDPDPTLLIGEYNEPTLDKVRRLADPREINQGANSRLEVI